MIDPTKLEAVKVTYVLEFYVVNDINIGSVIEREGKWIAESKFGHIRVKQFNTESEGLDWIKHYFCEWYNSVHNV